MCFIVVAKMNSPTWIDSKGLSSNGGNPVDRKKADVILENPTTTKSESPSSLMTYVLCPERPQLSSHLFPSCLPPPCHSALFDK